MKRIIIICEGETEQEFCKDVLLPYFISKNIQIQAPLIKKSKGGIVKWNVLKKEIETYLKNEPEVFVTLLIDFYGIKNKHKFPHWNEITKIQNKQNQLTKLEAEMQKDIDNSVNQRFIPYIQLHEFEGLLFCNKNIFDRNFERNEFKDYNYLIETIDNFPNPEDINDGKNTAPSKRLERIIEGYNKIVFGSMIAEEIGLKTIREKATRFNIWINNLEDITN
ncbi:MAG: DUF4276 family protein [Chlorobi bacterium]|nr:DUF4276 family protein [Chlorobiota bacterium]